MYAYNLQNLTLSQSNSLCFAWPVGGRYKNSSNACDGTSESDRFRYRYKGKPKTGVDVDVDADADADVGVGAAAVLELCIMVSLLGAQ